MSERSEYVLVKRSEIEHALDATDAAIQEYGEVPDWMAADEALSAALSADQTEDVARTIGSALCEATEGERAFYLRAAAIAMLAARAEVAAALDNDETWQEACDARYDKDEHAGSTQTAAVMRVCRAVALDVLTPKAGDELLLRGSRNVPESEPGTFRESMTPGGVGRAR